MAPTQNPMKLSSANLIRIQSNIADPLCAGTCICIQMCCHRCCGLSWNIGWQSRYSFQELTWHSGPFGLAASSFFLSLFTSQHWALAALSNPKLRLLAKRPTVQPFSPSSLGPTFTKDFQALGELGLHIDAGLGHRCRTTHATGKDLAFWLQYGPPWKFELF